MLPPAWPPNLLSTRRRASRSSSTPRPRTSWPVDSYHSCRTAARHHGLLRGRVLPPSCYPQRLRCCHRAARTSTILYVSTPRYNLVGEQGNIVGGQYSLASSKELTPKHVFVVGKDDIIHTSLTVGLPAWSKWPSQRQSWPQQPLRARLEGCGCSTTPWRRVVIRTSAVGQVGKTRCV